MIIDDMKDNELKTELEAIIKELQERNIPYCLKCGATDFFNPNCKDCKETEKECFIPTEIENKEIILHLKDILEECKGRREMGQIEHNVFEIAEHLGIDIKSLIKIEK